MVAGEGYGKKEGGLVSEDGRRGGGSGRVNGEDYEEGLLKMNARNLLFAEQTLEPAYHDRYGMEREVYGAGEGKLVHTWVWGLEGSNGHAWLRHWRRKDLYIDSHTVSISDSRSSKQEVLAHEIQNYNIK